ncbi:MAG: HD domain-containing protein [Treponema sp.]|nr:HD domain-containing protein [Treponema sp.]
MAVLEMICKSGFSAYLHGYGAIDEWLGIKRNENCHFIFTNAGTSDLARLFEGLRFPGVCLADAALDINNYIWYFRCADSFNENHPSYSILEFYKDCSSRVYKDPRGIYPVLKEIRQIRKTGNEYSNLSAFFNECINRGTDRIRALTDASLILAKYFTAVNAKDLKAELDKTAELFFDLHEGSPPCQEEQRILLCGLITSPNPGTGLEMLKIGGFIGKYWPELAILEEADHSKEFHPEGNAWEHTMEALRHRKAGTVDLPLSLGLLLHDLGKPIASSAGNHRYEGHAELGEIQSRRFLDRLGFSPPLIADVCFLVRNHMLPAALPRLPLYRTSEIMSSRLFPRLMELYRCDESSSYKGLHGYYESSAKYQQFLRNQRNPYRRKK